MSDNSRYVYDTTQKGMLEKAKEAGGWLFWCVMVGGGGGCVYFHQHMGGGLYNAILGFFIGMSVFAFVAVIVKLFDIK